MTSLRFVKKLHPILAQYLTFLIASIANVFFLNTTTSTAPNRLSFQITGYGKVIGCQRFSTLIFANNFYGSVV